MTYLYYKRPDTKCPINFINIQILVKIANNFVENLIHDGHHVSVEDFVPNIKFLKI